MQWLTYYLFTHSFVTLFICQLYLGVSAEEISDTENLPSTARPATSRSQSSGQTRAIARTQQSERVRANVNRHRISQARTSQVWHEA